MPAGRPPIHLDAREARRAANRRAKARADERGFVQRSILLPADCWQQLRNARAPGESSYAQTIARLLNNQT